MTERIKTIRRLRLYKPHHIQMLMHNSTARFNVAVLGRQSGKSTYAINKLMDCAYKNRRHIYWFVSPTWKQAKIMYRRIEKMVARNRNRIIKKSLATELMFQFYSDSCLFFVSADNPNSLRSETLNGSVIDEVREQDPDLFSLVIRPMLTTTGGWCDFISTPNGYDQFFDIAEFAKSDKTGKWACFHSPSTCNPKFTQEEYEEAKSSMTEAQFDQEIDANFRDLTAGKVYSMYGDRNMTDVSPFATLTDFSPNLPIVVAPDFNLSPMAWGLGQIFNSRVHWHDEIFFERSNTQETVEELVGRVQGHKLGVIVCGDATSKKEHTASASKTDYDIIFGRLREKNIPFEDETPDSNPAIKDRVNTMNARFFDANGTITQTHHSRCKKMRRDFQRVVWKDGANYVLNPGKKRELTHSSDGPGYAVCQLAPLPSRWEVGRLRVIPSQ